MLGTDEMRAWYGPDHVALAADRGAVGTLLISDELFRLVGFICSNPIIILMSCRSNDPEVRKRYVALVERVRETAGEVLIFSSMHESGQRKFSQAGLLSIAQLTRCDRAQSADRSRCSSDVSS
jgi:protein pelota